MKTLLERLLDYYHLTYEEYLQITAPVNEDNFFMGKSFDNIENVVDIVKNAITNKKKIIIYGDYDADGIMATSIMVKMFKYLSYDVSYYIPSRYLDGYGINLNKAEEIVKNGYELVITVDNGISAFEPISYLRSHNVDVLVLDHHELQGHLPECNAFLHPTLSNFGEVASSGAFTCFMFSMRFLNRYDKYLATLASISLISDMMPLKEYNRNLLRTVIENYVDGEFPAIDYLKETDKFSETAIGMKISPKINSIGRLLEDDSVNKIVEYFVTDDNEVRLNYLSWINSVNEDRKTVSKTAIELNISFPEDNASIVYVTNEKEGVIGLIANNLMSKYKKPAIVLTLDSSKESYKGSCRAPEGFNVVEAFESLKEYLPTFGGHALAGGCSVSASKIDEFSKAFEEYVKAHPIQKVEKEAIQFYVRELNMDNYNIVSSFAPFGESMKSPLFRLPRIKVSGLLFSKDGKHILTQIGTNTKIIGFNFPKDEVTLHDYVDLIGTLRVNEYRGYKNLEFLISEIQES